MVTSAMRHPILAIRRRRVLPLWVRRLDARTGAGINRRSSHPRVDRMLVLLSTTANRGVLWFSIAGVLALLGQRRAAVRGAASLAVASAVANLLGKQLF